MGPEAVYLAEPSPIHHGEGLVFNNQIHTAPSATPPSVILARAQPVLTVR